MLSIADLKITVIGLGYVGLSLAVEIGKKLSVVGFDIHQKRIDELKIGQDYIILSLCRNKYVVYDLKSVLSNCSDILKK